MVTDERDTNDRRFDDLIKLHELYTNVQLQSDTIYYNRTNLILVAEGLLLVSFPSLLAQGVPLYVSLIAGIGTWLSMIWFLLEQRNRIHFTGREEACLKPIERTLLELAQRDGRAFVAFWTLVPGWVENNARWYQRHSAQRLMRVYTPATFLLAWIVILAYTILRSI